MAHDFIEQRGGGEARFEEFARAARVANPLLYAKLEAAKKARLRTRYQS